MNAVPLHDVNDVEGFVRAQIERHCGGLSLDSQEREEMVAEGLVILFDMGRKFVSRMEGYDQDGSFAGYCSRFFKLKLVDAWHDLHPEHVLRTQEDGTRAWEYHDPADSWEAKQEANESAAELSAHIAHGNGAAAVAFREDRLRTPGDFASILYKPKEAA